VDICNWGLSCDSDNKVERTTSGGGQVRLVCTCLSSLALFRKVGAELIELEET
jgi:hypothetical protein